MAGRPKVIIPKSLNSQFKIHNSQITIERIESQLYRPVKRILLTLKNPPFSPKIYLTNNLSVMYEVADFWHSAIS